MIQGSVMPSWRRGVGVLPLVIWHLSCAAPLTYMFLEAPDNKKQQVKHKARSFGESPPTVQ